MTGDHAHYGATNGDDEIEAADSPEEIFDPLDGLVEKTESDPGAPFKPEIVNWLAAVKKNDRAAFEALRAQLKKAGCRVTAHAGRDEQVAVLARQRTQRRGIRVEQRAQDRGKR